MKFLLIPRASHDSKPGTHHAPDEKAIVELMKYNEALHTAGVLVTSEGLSPAKSAHVIFSGGKGKVLDGPYAETKELIGGFYMIEVKSLEEATSWALRYPGGFGNDDVIEVRPLTGAEDIPPEFMQLIAKAAPTWVETLTKKAK
jgi:hypothetical protein